MSCASTTSLIRTAAATTSLFRTVFDELRSDDVADTDGFLDDVPDTAGFSTCQGLLSCAERLRRWPGVTFKFEGHGGSSLHLASAAARSTGGAGWPRPWCCRCLRPRPTLTQAFLAAPDAGAGLCVERQPLRGPIVLPAGKRVRHVYEALGDTAEPLDQVTSMFRAGFPWPRPTPTHAFSAAPDVGAGLRTSVNPATSR
jgi:hypothetical protein